MSARPLLPSGGAYLMSTRYLRLGPRHVFAPVLRSLQTGLVSSSAMSVRLSVCLSALIAATLLIVS